MSTWPTILPPYIEQDSYNQVAQDPVLRTSTETGPSKSRLRFTAVTVTVTGVIKLTREQAIALDTFWRVDCVYGAIPFNWVRPIEQTPCVMRFKAPPAIVANGAAFVANLNLEILP